MDNKNINKDDDQGYLSLYLAKTALTEKEKNTILKYSLAFVSFCFILSIPVVSITNFFYAVPIITSISTLSIFPVTNHVIKNEIKKVAKKYPHIDVTTSVNDLEKILNNSLVEKEVEHQSKNDNIVINYCDSTNVIDKPKVKCLVKEKHRNE